MVRSPSGKFCAKMGNQGVERTHRVRGYSHEPMKVYMLTWVMYTSKCLFGYVVASYFSLVKFFQLEGRFTSMMLGTKRFLNYNNCLPNVLRDRGIVFRHTLLLVALGKPIVVELTSPPSNKLASGCRDPWASRRWVFLHWRASTSLMWCLCI